MNKENLKKIVRELALLNIKVAKNLDVTNLREVDRIIYGNSFRVTYGEAVNNMIKANKRLELKKEIENLKFKIDSSCLKDLYMGMTFTPSQRLNKSALERELEKYYLICTLSA